MSDETLISGAQDNTDAPDTNTSEQSPSDEVTEAQADAEEAKPEGEADGQTEEAGDGQSEEASDSDAVPEEYEAFNLPENVELDASALDAATPVFKDIGLTQEQSQKLVDLFAGITQQRSEALAEQAASIRSEWQEGIKTHQEFGGDKLDQSLALTRRAIDAAFGKIAEPTDGSDAKTVETFLEHPNTQFRQLLADTGVGDNPLFFEFMVKVGKTVSEGSFVNSSTAPKVDKTTADVLYPQS